MGRKPGTKNKIKKVQRKKIFQPVLLNNSTVLSQSFSENNIEPTFCSLIPMREWLNLLPDEQQVDEIRYGRYIPSQYPVKGNYYPVGLFISCDWESLSVDFSREEILQKCIAHLNTPPERKKYAKKDPVPLYGIFSDQIIWSKFLPDNKIHAVLAVNVPAHKNYWSAANGYKEMAGGESIIKEDTGTNEGLEEEVKVVEKEVPLDENGNPVKKKRGRPRKNPLPE